MAARVAVVVLTMDNFADTAECLDSVLRSSFRDFEIVLVDNHSTDGSIEKIRTRFPSIHYVENTSNLGVAGGRNSGWLYAREHLAPDILLFLDNDAVIEPGTIETLVAYLDAHPEAGILCAKAYTAPPSKTIMSAGMYVNLYTGSIGDVGSGEPDEGQYDQAGPVPACGGFCFLVRHSVFEECGGLDEGYNPYGWEDVDLCIRARRADHQVHYVPAAVVYHKGCKIGRGYVPLYEKYKTRHFFRLLMRHTTLLQKACWGSIVAMRGLYIMVRLVLRGDGRIAMAQLSGAWDLLAKRWRRTR